MDVLVHLADHADEVVSRDALLSAVWHDATVGDGSVYLAINQLRRALEDGTGGRRYIETIPKRGYRLVAPVARDATPATDAARRPLISRRSLFSGLGAAAAALVTGALVFSRGFTSDARAYGRRAFYLSQQLTSTIFGPSVAAEDISRTEQELRKNAEQALALDAADGWARLALGNLYLFTWRWSDARRELERAYTVETDAPVAPSYLLLLAYQGLHEEADSVAERALRVGPDRQGGYALKAMSLAHTRDYEGAKRAFNTAFAAAAGNIEQTDRAFDSDRAFRRMMKLLIAVEIGGGDPEQARRMLEAFHNPLSPYLAARVGNRRQAEEALDDLGRRVRNGETIGTGQWVETHLAMGDEREALRWLEAAAGKARDHAPDEAFFQLMDVKLNVSKDPVLEQPAFADVLSRIRGA